jgi:hypothetical protein
MEATQINSVTLIYNKVETITTTLYGYWMYINDEDKSNIFYSEDEVEAVISHFLNNDIRVKIYDTRKNK